jgi:hypothetical protein
MSGELVLPPLPTSCRKARTFPRDEAEVGRMAAQTLGYGGQDFGELSRAAVLVLEGVAVKRRKRAVESWSNGVLELWRDKVSPYR